MFFAGLREFGPEFGHTPRDVDLVLLQNMQQTAAGDSFDRRPDQNNRATRPRLSRAAMAKAAVKIDNRFAVLPNRNGSAQLAELLEIFSEERLQALAQFVGIKFHSRNMEGRPPCRPHLLGRD